jgi:uncharacterized membrane protein YccF (DUF307 family)
LLRILYFFLFGWWATGVWINVAWFLNVTIIGLPLGLWMLNRVPQVLTLQPTKQVLVTTGDGQAVKVHTRSLPQHPWPLRLLYFALVGWWFSWLWSNVAWAISATVIGLPLGIWMFNRLPAITTLMRS